MGYLLNALWDLRDYIIESFQSTYKIFSNRMIHARQVTFQLLFRVNPDMAAYQGHEAQRAHDAKTTLLLRQNDIMTSF